MQRFTDLTGREWQMSLTYGIARQLKAKSSEPVDVLEPESFQPALDDLYRRFDLIWELCQASHPDVTQEQFDAAIADSETFAVVNAALLAELTDFFHRAGRPELAALIEKVKAASDRIRDVAVAKVNDPKVTQAIDRQLRDAEAAIDAELDSRLSELGTNSKS